MEAPTKKRLRLDEFLHKVLLELPVLSGSEMEQAHLVERHLGLDTRLEDELMALRWWYLSHLLFGQLVHRGHTGTKDALHIVEVFAAQRDQVLSQMNLDFAMRCEFYERALQNDLCDEGGGFHIYDCFEKFVGQPNEVLREFYFASMTGVATRLAKAVERFEIVA